MLNVSALFFESDKVSYIHCSRKFWTILRRLRRFFDSYNKLLVLVFVKLYWSCRLNWEFFPNSKYWNEKKRLRDLIKLSASKFISPDNGSCFRTSKILKTILSRVLYNSFYFELQEIYLPTKIRNTSAKSRKLSAK
jgi:hypothetical protein